MCWPRNYVTIMCWPRNYVTIYVLTKKLRDYSCADHCWNFSGSLFSWPVHRNKQAFLFKILRKVKYLSNTIHASRLNDEEYNMWCHVWTQFRKSCTGAVGDGRLSSRPPGLHGTVPSSIPTVSLKIRNRAGYVKKKPTLATILDVNNIENKYFIIYSNQ
jgi:hypothetical protein